MKSCKIFVLLIMSLKELQPFKFRNQHTVSTATVLLFSSLYTVFLAIINKLQKKKKDQYLILSLCMLEVTANSNYKQWHNIGAINRSGRYHSYCIVLHVSKIVLTAFYTITDECINSYLKATTRFNHMINNHTLYDLQGSSTKYVSLGPCTETKHKPLGKILHLTIS
jgi:hypothetical protein